MQKNNYLTFKKNNNLTFKRVLLIEKLTKIDKETILFNKIESVLKSMLKNNNKN
jgi:hypothetical protein